MSTEQPTPEATQIDCYSNDNELWFADIERCVALQVRADALAVKASELWEEIIERQNGTVEPMPMIVMGIGGFAIAHYWPIRQLHAAWLEKRSDKLSERAGALLQQLTAR